MIRFLLLFIWLPLFALDISIQSGKESSEPYSILHLRDTKPFNCVSTKNDFDQISRIECTLNDSSTLPNINNPHFTLAKTASILIITPKTKIALFPVGFDLRYDSQIYTANAKGVNHWNIIGYSKTIPMLPNEKRSSNGINLPMKLAKESYPYVGGLDLKGNPIKMKNVEDVNGYMDLKKAYAASDYTKVLYIAQDILKHYPKTIFSNELILYQIRAYYAMGNYEGLLPLSKQFLRQYSGDPNMAEVLAYTGDAYSQMGQNSDSDYFYDRLFSEHPSELFAQKGMYYKAKHLEVVGSPTKAAKYYREALSRTKDVDLASACAFELAQMEIGGKTPEKARDYIDKIARVNPHYFTKVTPESLEMIDILDGRKDYLIAAKITQSLIEGVNHKSPEHGKLLKNLGILYAEAGKKNQALDAFNEYLKLFPYGEYLTEVQRQKDGLFFEKEDGNNTSGIKKYDELIERYGNDSIGNKALYKKAQLLFKQGKYDEILKMENELYKLDTTAYPDANGLIGKSAIEITKKNLQNSKCEEAMSMHKMYQIKLPTEWDGLTFECALKMSKFPLAEQLVSKNIKSKDMATRQQWLYRSIKMNFALGEYKKALSGGRDLSALLSVQQNPPLNDAYRILFDSAQRSGDSVNMVQYIKECENVFGSDFKDIERYTQMMSLGLSRKDEAMVQTYGQKVIALQKRTKTATQSPFVEFTLAQSLINQDKNKEALEILKGLNGVKLSDEKRSRQYYLMGSLSMKLGNNTEARSSFNASIKADKNSAWGKLAKDALGLL
ncbi:MAG: tetratricopeptide repeat protein [Sulfuricurvum sp.]|uniref:tetratricopeptide repeat protein n=1 Tax=Sulfuricurvum sp. TaxID=2025608 RepID=UPI00260BF591|nr:tetratricopeptide repeat protein [Sulfuricurvum sp.]MDD2828236.1 tetratricopeptide repeat protein [Sulfuricurvum sp.]MDD4949809.1 tetratricopeptide repeat protein [Sulfuricurvum sp.]